MSEERWDERYRMLRKGEIVRATDESLDDDGQWRKVGENAPDLGRKAPDPRFTSHVWYRRRRDNL